MTNIEHLVENGINATLRGCFKEAMSQEHNKMMLEMEKNKISESTLWEIVQYIVYTKDGVDKKEIRAKAIDEVMEIVKKAYHNFSGYDLEFMTKYGNKNASQQAESYSTLMLYEIAGEFDDLLDCLEQLKGGAEWQI